MKIDHIRCRVVSHPLPAPLRPAWAPGRTFERTACTLVEITTDEGLTGLGALPHADPIGLHTVSELVAPYILGKDPFAVERISPILRHAARDGGLSLGRRDGPVGHHRPGLQPTGLSPVGRLPGLAAGLCQPGRDLRAGRTDRATAHAARKGLPGRQAADSGGPTSTPTSTSSSGCAPSLATRWTSWPMPTRRTSCPAPARTTFGRLPTRSRWPGRWRNWTCCGWRNPCPATTTSSSSALTARVDLPIAGGELNIGLHEYRQLIERNCYDIIQADAAFSEGVFQLRKVAALAEMAFKPFIPHTWSNGIGLGANLHLAAATPNCPWFEFPVDPPAWTEESRDFMLTEPYTINADGTISVPDAPGFGFKLDQDASVTAPSRVWESDTRRLPDRRGNRLIRFWTQAQESAVGSLHPAVGSQIG